MLKYFIKRVMALVLIMIVVSLASFWLLRFTSGNVVNNVLGTDYTPQNAKAFIDQFGLDRGFWAQYASWAWHALHGDLGYSYTARSTTVNSQILASLPLTLVVGLSSQVIALVVAVPLAVLVSRNPNGLLDRITTTAIFLLLAIPSFVLIVFAIQFFSVTHHWLPGSDAAVSWSWTPAGAWNSIHSVLVGSMVVAVGSIASYYRFLRSDLIANLQEDFVLMARSKGISNARILWRHVFRPSSTTLIASIGLSLGNVIAGVLVVEGALNFPGIGLLLLGAINGDDWNMIQGIAVFVGFFVVVIIFIADFLLTVVDPRIPRE